MHYSLRDRVLAMTVVGFVLMIMGGCIGLDIVEMKLRGVAAVAQVTGYRNLEDDRGGNLPDRYVKYAWTDPAGKRMLGYDKVARTWTPGPNNTVDILYLPGQEVAGTVKSRLRENSRNSPYYFFFGGLALTVVCGSATLIMLRRETPD